MRVLILGGTGLIGAAVIRELIKHRHKVLALSRSTRSMAMLKALGASPVRGDLRAPDAWVQSVRRVDAIIQVAATFTEDMGQVESKALEAIIQALGRKDGKIHLIYTGGVWLYGATGNSIANETTQFQPIPSFFWMVETSEKLLHTQAFSTAVMHPAMVYHQKGGAFSRFIDCAKQHKQIEIWGDRATRWPLIHRDDLAVAYRLLLERPKLTGHFNASAQIGVRVDTIAKTIAQKYRSPNGFKVVPAATVRQKYGFWADGPMLDQQMESSRLQTLCDWKPVITDFATCL